MPSSDFFNILIHHRLVAAIRRREPAFRQRLQRTLEGLQFGCWGNGTRVKILRGAAKPVYEARVSRACRLLFTVARAPTTQPPYNPELFVLAWDLLEHDAVGRRSKRMNVVPETGFLDFSPVAEMSLDGPPPAPDADVPKEGTADSLRRALRTRAPANAGSDLRDCIRWFALDPNIVADEAEWQALLEDGRVEELELKLSREQAETVFRPGPVLLRGTAGSGKTTVSVYRLARLAAEQPGSRILYVTYSEALLEYVQRLFDDLLRARRWPPPATPPDFLCFPRLYRRLRHADETAPVLRFPAFAQWYRNIYRANDAALAWEEIRGIIKGACLDPHKDSLSAAEYRKLGRKRAPLFVDARPRLYGVFERYREWCRGTQRADDIDLARSALRALDNDTDRYDGIVCDEGQDLTELEISLLLRLCRDPSGLFFTADPQQIVNPSGFRWAEIRSLLRHARYRAAVEVIGLSRNYRSVASVVALANAFIGIQRRRTGRSDDDGLQESSLRGPSPVAVAGDEQAVIEQIRDFGPRCAVIAGSPDEAARLSRSLASERVFAIPDVKGLEFEGCVLWNLFGTDSALWQSILVGSEPMKEDPVARRAIHHAYVAVTRARRYLGVYEGSAAAAALWQSPDLRPLIETDDPSSLSRFMVTAATPEEWLEQGRYFAARGRHKQAAECYRRGGDSRLAQQALASFSESIEAYAEAAETYLRMDLTARAAACFEKDGQHEQAARLYREVENWPDAARNFERSRAWRDAAAAYQKADDLIGYRRCQMAALVRGRDWNAAAKLALKQGDLDVAAEHFQRAGRRDRARELRRRIAERDEDHAKLAQLFEAERRWPEAAAAHRRNGNTTAAARCQARAAEAAGEWAAAAAAWCQAGDMRDADRCEIRAAEAAEHWLQAARLHENKRDRAAARRCLQRADDNVAREWLKAMDLEDAGDAVEAALAWEDVGQYAQAEEQAKLALSLNPRIYEARMRAFGGTRDPWYDRYRAGSVETRCCARRIWREGQGKHALSLFKPHACLQRDRELFAAIAEDVGDNETAGRQYEKLRQWDAAERCFRKAGNAKRLAVVQARQAEERGEFAVATDRWRQTGRKRDTNRCAGKAAEAAGDYNTAARFYDQARMTAQARRVRGLAAADAQPELFPEPADNNDERGER